MRHGATKALSFTDIEQGSHKAFDIVKEYKSLNANAKFVICENLFVEGRRYFLDSVETIWPQSNKKDAQKLALYLHQLKIRKLH